MKIEAKIWFVIAMFTMAALSYRPVSAQQGDPRFASFQKEIDPMLVPAVDTAVPGISATVYVNEITLTNVTGGDVTCSILDRQATPRAVFSNTVHPGVYIMPFKGRKMPNGITWSCTGGGTAVVGYIFYSAGRY